MNNQRSTQDDKLVSVIVPVYKVEEYLERCVDSIINQTYPNLEIILVDDGSPDNCPTICDEYAKKDNRIKVIHKQNGGLMAAWMDGVKVAIGKYIYFVDSDDWLELDSVEKYLSIALDTGVDLILNNFFISSETSKEASFATEYAQKGFLDQKATEQFKDEIINNELEVSYYRWNKFFKKHLIIDNLKYCDPRITKFEDVCISLASILDAKTIYIDAQPSYNYYVRESSMIRASYNKQDISNHKKVIDSVIGMLKAKKFACDKYLSRLQSWLTMCIIDTIVKNDADTDYLLNELYDSELVQNEYTGVTLKNLKHTKCYSFKWFINKILIKKTYRKFVKKKYKSCVKIRRFVDKLKNYIKK